MDRFQSHPWQRLALAAVIAVGIGLSAILAVHFSNAQIEERRHQLMVEATGFAGAIQSKIAVLAEGPSLGRASTATSRVA